MDALPTLLAHTNMTWYLLPLAAVISLVYSASRYEQTERILRRAGKLFAQIILFMGAILALLAMLSYRL
ncbi:hypothetical protein [Maioricimonas sp. JC845]|uniref:hypothetical protein n=1 Tax=Maioricimonas sp. JC845 TaxID=3232138 RepID=UPI00345950A1